MESLSKIIEILRNQKEVSGEEMASELGISRTSVWKNINRLKGKGFNIISSRRGYRMIEEADLLLPYRLRGLINTKIIGRHIEYFAHCDSSNNIAKKLAREGLKEGTLIICEEQEAGRGRLERKWISPRGGLWFSVILKPSMTPVEAPGLGFLTSLSVVKTLRRRYGLEASLKWPNDVLINGKKVCGVLVEVEAEMDILHFAVVGVGLDANISIKDFPEEVQDIATTLKEELGREVDRAKLLADILSEMERNYNSFTLYGLESIFQEYIDLCSTIQKEVRVVQHGREIKGKAVEIDKEGALIVLTSEGRVRITYGDCFHLTNT